MFFVQQSKAEWKLVQNIVNGNEANDNLTAVFLENYKAEYLQG